MFCCTWNYCPFLHSYGLTGLKLRVETSGLVMQGLLLHSVQYEMLLTERYGIYTIDFVKRQKIH